MDISNITNLFHEFLTISQLKKKNSFIDLEHFELFLKSRGHSQINIYNFFLQNPSLIQTSCDNPINISFNNSEPSNFQTLFNLSMNSSQNSYQIASSYISSVKKKQKRQKKIN